MLTSSFPLPSAPSWGTFVGSLADALANTGVTMQVITMSPDKQKHEYVTDAGIAVFAYPYTRLLPPRLHSAPGILPSIRKHPLASLQVPGYLSSTTQALKQHVAAFQPDLIHAHWLVPGGLTATRAAQAHNVPVVTTGWGADCCLPRWWLVSRCLRNVCARSACTSFVSEHLRQQAVEHGVPLERSCVIPNATDTDTFRPRAQSSSRLFHIGIVSRLVPHKQVDHALQAIGSLPQALRKGMIVTVIGEGDEQAKLQALAQALKIDPISFLGDLPHAALPEQYQQFDVLMQPSRQEGMSTAVLEAMACAVPVIAYDGQAHREIITDGHDGYLVPNGDIAALGTTLAQSMHDAETRHALGQRARQTVLERFSRDAVAKQYYDLYQNVCQHKQEMCTAM